jgi:hypothetical protein
MQPARRQQRAEGRITMGKATTLLVLVMALVPAIAGRAATPVTTDFSKDASGWSLNGNARLAKLSEAKVATLGGAKLEQVLELTSSEENQASAVWTEVKQKVPSFSFIAEVRIRYDGGGFNDCPSDGVTLAFAPVNKDAKGSEGGSLGLFGGAIETFTAFELNTFSAQGLGSEEEMQNCMAGKHVTFAIDVVHPGTDTERTPGMSGTLEKGGAKIGQVLPPEGMKVVNGGWFRYQWNVAENGTMTVYATGLDEENKKFQKVKILEVKFPDNKAIDFEGRWGLTAGTGAGFETVEVAKGRVETPMVEPQ